MDLSLLRLDPTAITEGTTVSPSDEIDDPSLDRGPEGTSISGADEIGSTEPEAASHAPAPEPTDPNIGAATRKVSPEGGWRGVADVARSLGFTFPEGVSDDNAALVHLVQRANTARQADYYAQIGRQLAPHANKLMPLLQQQASPPPAAPSPWEKPEFNPKWADLVQRDAASGLFVGKPGVPPEIVDKVNRYVDWAERREQDPEAYQAYVADKVFEKRFAERFAQEQAKYAENSAVREIQQANAGWFYQTDDTGQVVYGNDSKPVVSPVGQRYLDHLRTAGKIGIRDVRQQDHYARSMTEREVFAARIQQSEASRQQAASPQTMQAQTPPNRNVTGSLPAQDRVTRPDPEVPSSVGLSLNDTLRRSLAEFQDDDFDLSR